MWSPRVLWLCRRCRAGTNILTVASRLPGRVVRAAANRVPLALLRSPLAPLLHLRSQLLGLTITGRRTGRRLSLVVQYVEHAGSILVLAGNAERKRWWRNLIEPARVGFVLHGTQRTGIARVVDRPDEWTAEAVAAYLRRYPASARARVFPPGVAVNPELVAQLTAGAVLVRIDPD